MIKRKAEAEIIELLKEFPAVGVLGPRQIGKTTLADRELKMINQPFFCPLIGSSIFISLSLN